MDLQTVLNNMAMAGRAGTFSQSDQLSLGELILKLEGILKTKDKPDETKVFFDFEYLFPTEFDSWRGIYAELALEFTTYSYGEDAKKPLSLPAFYQLCKETIGKKFTGYKGGDFVMGKTTPIWVANWGNSGNTALIDVIDSSHGVILITGLRDA